MHILLLFIVILTHYKALRDVGQQSRWQEKKGPALGGAQ